MTPRELDNYTFDRYCEEFFPDDRREAAAVVTAYAAGIGLIPPTPKVDGMTPVKIANFFAIAWITQEQITNLLLAKILKKLEERPL